MHQLNMLFHHVLSLVEDQLITLLITIVVVDRWIEWKERRRWRSVQKLVFIQLEAVLGDVLRIWARWLTCLREHGERIPASETAHALFQQKHWLMTASLPPEDFEDFVKLCAGDAIPDSESAFVETVHPDNFRHQLRAYLAEMSLAPSSRGWTALLRTLKPAVLRLSDLVKGLPEKVLSERMDYLQAIEEMNLLLRRVDPKLSGATWSDEVDRIQRAQDISHNIGMVMAMVKYVRVVRRGLA